MKSRTARLLFATALGLAAVGRSGPVRPLSAQDARPTMYRAYVASESDDVVSLVAFRPGGGLTVEKVIPVGFLPAETEGPHGLAVSRDGTEWFVTLAHGINNGSLLRYRTGADTLVGRVELGLFPATVTTSRDGLFALAVNSNFFGDMDPSTISIVEVATMTEVARPVTCTMPHGSRIGFDRRYHYSTCMMDDALVQTDLRSLGVSRMLNVATGAAMASPGHRHGAPPTCSPTWAAPSPAAPVVYVLCNKGDEIVEVDAQSWMVRRRWAAPRGPYNGDLTPDGHRLVVTEKQGSEVTVWDLESATELARLPTARKVAHGVAITADGRYAFVTAEGIGGEPGSVQVLDLATLAFVAGADVEKQAGGVAFWRAD